ncbi:MAG: hypothetical protein WCK54_14030 [Desulfuromonadales bacterium]
MKNRINTILERRSVNIPLNAVIFLTNFVIVSSLWRHSAPDLTGLGRLTLCWAAASGLTWLITSFATGVVRLALAFILLCVLTYIMTLHGM